MKRAKAKGFCDTFLNPKYIPAVILLLVIICVLSGIIGTSHLKPNGRVTLLSATVTMVKPIGQPALDESKMKTQSEKAGSTGIANSSVDNSEQSGQWQIVQMRVTAYCPCQKCCGKYSDGVTACGHKIRPRDVFVAADKRYPFGTEMIIAGYNNGKPVKVLDRGGAIRGNRLDVFFHSHQEALKWGVKYLNVKVRCK